MHKKLLQAWISEQAKEFSAQRKEELNIRTNKQYIMYLLKKDGYKLNPNDL